MPAWAWVAVIACTFAVIGYDCAARRVPNALVLAGGMLATVLLLTGHTVWPGLSWIVAVGSGGAGLLVFGLFYARRWMGAGDVKFFAVAGLLVGPVGLCLVWLTASLLGGLHALVLALRARRYPEAVGRGIPYAAYMAVGLLLLMALRPGIERVT